MAEDKGLCASGAVDTSTRARHAWLVRESREAPYIGGYILVSP